LVFIALGSLNAMAHDSMFKYGIAISHDGEQIAYGCQRQFKFDPLIDGIAEVKLTHLRY
jgi:hypothetical protein